MVDVSTIVVGLASWVGFSVVSGLFELLGAGTVAIVDCLFFSLSEDRGFFSFVMGAPGGVGCNDEAI